MCGITGFIDSINKNGLDVLRKMTDTMLHRGPDDSGYTFFKNQNAGIGLGFRRLSIIDISELGHQPMEFENLTIVFNGEVYNFAEIKNDLVQLGYSFISKSDTEVILKAFHRWGIEAVNRFNGMFAIAIYDKLSEELFLIRDRIGVKPLYYFIHDKHFVFASELKPIMSYPDFHKEIDTHALNMYLFHGYITAPYSIFKNVYKLEPGKYLIYKNQKTEVKTYWSIEEKYKEIKILHDISETEAINELDKLITSSVKYRMISDVPLGCFLSGGIDSSLVAAVMQKLSVQPINTFTIGFNEKKYNEANYAKEVAKHIGSNHNELYLPINDAKKLIEDIPKFYDEPFADSSQLPTMLVSRFARKNVTVILSGDGGDEFFCGYEQYQYVFRFQKFKLLSNLLNKIYKLIDIKRILASFDMRFLKLFYMNNNTNIINSTYLFSVPYLNKLVKNNLYQIEKKYFTIPELSKNIQEAYMLLDMMTYLPDDICTKVDRATMSVSLEGREPLLDYRLIEYCFSLPHHFKYRDNQKKYVLKQLAYRYIPQKLLDRPKMGFGVPVYKWLYKDLHYLIEEYLSKDFISKQDIFDNNEIRELVGKFEKSKKTEYFPRLIWHLLIFQMWYKEYL